MKLLFTGGGGAGSSALMSLLNGSRYEVHFCDADLEAKPYNVPADRWHEIPKASDTPECMKALHGLCVQLGIDLLIPGVDEELLPLAMYRTWQAFPCAMLLPEAEFISIHQDKLWSMRKLREAGIPAPETDRAGYIPKFPCIVKPRMGRGSRDVQIVKTEAGLGRALRGQSAVFVVQEYLAGQEYTVTMVADRQQRLRAIVPVRVDLKKGVTIRGVTEHNRSVISACEQIHAAMPTSGVYNIQGMLTNEGFRPFEINPRVSTTLCLAIASGVDVIGLSQSEEYSALRTFRETLLRRSWHTEMRDIGPVAQESGPYWQVG